MEDQSSDESQASQFIQNTGTDSAEGQRWRMEIEPLDLGADVRAVGFELIDPETREPLTGADAGRTWAATLGALAGAEPWVLDFFAHLERVRDYCRLQGIAYREPNARVLLVPAPKAEALGALFERFAGETFGVRAGALVSGDASVEGGLAERGVDAYHTAYPGYLFCGVCDFENGFFTLLSERLWASEVIRRTRAAVANLPVDVVRPA
jgi:hypothetical protein